MRPHVSLDDDSRRKITWPSNTFYACETPNLEHDVVVFLGVEPHLQWGRFSKIILSMVRECRVRMAVTVGALLADVYHRNRVRITGTSTNPDLASQLGLKPSRYEGPTGIVGVLNNLFRDENLPAVSVWANVPHYVNVTPTRKRRSHSWSGSASFSPIPSISPNSRRARMNSRRRSMKRWRKQVGARLRGATQAQR